jgi:DNA-binding NarL/FixJ family response regulator
MRVAVIDEQPLARMGVEAVCGREAGILFCGGAGDAREGYRLLDEQRPDVVVIDLQLPGTSGIAAAREIRRRWSTMKILILTGSCCEYDVLAALAAGASGYVTKADPPSALIEGLRSAAGGSPFLGPHVRALALPPLPARGSGTLVDVLAELSNRQREVFALAVYGFRNKEIGRELCVAVKTVGSHRLHINRKLGCSSIAELVYFAAVNGLLPHPVVTTPAQPEAA